MKHEKVIDCSKEKRKLKIIFNVYPVNKSFMRRVFGLQRALRQTQGRMLSRVTISPAMAGSANGLHLNRIIMTIGL
ncbi:MAG TPA: hypothetical protein DGG95_18440 [Cytophagales bacterium]|jgi:hypothetical protein|nr:hypothetical protein [Cytophagales bacterium]